MPRSPGFNTSGSEGGRRYLVVERVVCLETAGGRAEEVRSDLRLHGRITVNVIRLGHGVGERVRGVKAEDAAKAQDDEIDCIALDEFREGDRVNERDVRRGGQGDRVLIV